MQGEEERVIFNLDEKYFLKIMDGSFPLCFSDQDMSQYLSGCAFI